MARLFSLLLRPVPRAQVLGSLERFTSAEGGGQGRRQCNAGRCSVGCWLLNSFCADVFLSRDIQLYLKNSHVIKIRREDGTFTNASIPAYRAMVRALRLHAVLKKQATRRVPIFSTAMRYGGHF